MKSVDISMVRPHLGGVPGVRPLPEAYTLRELGREDEPQLAGLLSSAFDAWDEERVASALTRTAEVKAVYGIVRNGALVATASSQSRPERDPAAGFVHWVATHPGHRAQGLASALLARLLEDFRERAYSRARLDTQPERLPAIRTYLKFGFVPEYLSGSDSRDHRAVWSDIFQALMRTGPTHP